MALAIGQRVRCHKNLHRGDWSITVRGKVVAHVPEITLADVTFKVRERARQRVIARQCREVHAWAEGLVANCGNGERMPISYNPYCAGSFVTRADGKALARCEFVHFTRAEGAVAVGKIDYAKESRWPR